MRWTKKYAQELFYLNAFKKEDWSLYTSAVLLSVVEWHAVTWFIYMGNGFPKNDIREVVPNVLDQYSDGFYSALLKKHCDTVLMDDWMCAISFLHY